MFGGKLGGSGAGLMVCSGLEEEEGFVGEGWAGDGTHSNFWRNPKMRQRLFETKRQRRPVGGLPS